MILHENKSLFNDAVRFTAQQMNLPPAYVEKDYWVTFALYTIFNNEAGKDTIFKGGTALSKCHNIINRFSEDIDLVVMRKYGETDSKLKSKLKVISKCIESVLPEIEIKGITNKMGMNRKTAHNYNKVFDGNFIQIRDVIVLESTWLGYYEPYTQKKIISFVGKMMINNNQAEIAEANQLTPFEVQALEPTRTLCEKIMSLVRFSYSINPIEDLRKKIRHTYDLNQLLKQEEILTFLNSDQFGIILLRVAQDDVVSFKNNNKWLLHHPTESLIFKDLESTWNEIKNTYLGEFRNLVYGEFPNEKTIFETLKLIQNRLTGIQWEVTL